MASAFLSSIQSTTTQVLGFVRRWASSSSSSSDPRNGVLKDLEKLERTLKRIQMVLLDAEEREIRHAAVKLWLEELRQVAYDAEDVLDEYHYEELRAQVEGRASRKRKRVEGDDEEEVSGSLSTTVLIPDGLGDRIREIRERFDEVSLDRERLRLREEDGERRVSSEAAFPPPTSHMVDESKICGREDDKQRIIDLLLSDRMGNGISVIPIVGKGGLGKTTIAQLVYNDSKVKEYFNLTGWVCVSDDFNVTRLTKDIIGSIINKPYEDAQLSTLQNTLNEMVKEKKVLLVLDDVWNEQPSLWESLRIPFIGAETVRIILTCRNDSVAEIMQTVDPYRPACLSEEQSWSLFRHYAFGGGDYEEQSSLVDIGKQIVNKCSGLPLAVKTIGSLLRYMTDEDGWMDVLESDLWEVDKNNETLAALRLSYNRMPAHLKPCFVYCSMFPKDYVFHKDALVRLWMAQGYITPQGIKKLEDIGDEYFNDLQRRSFFDYYWSSFKMHDMIHDLAKSIAGNECSSTMVDEKLGDFPNYEVRHLYLKAQENLVKPLSSTNLRALRTLFIKERFRFVEATELSLLLPMTECLRTLVFDRVSIGELGGSVGKLKHLRYLYIHSKSLERLPKSVCLLYHLQTLILDCHRLVELPDGLGNLLNLRYSHIRSISLERLPESVCLLYHLQALILDCDRLVELPDGLGNLISLRYLQLRWDSRIKILPASIWELHSLQTLRIQSCEQLPCCIGNFTNLRHLEVIGGAYSCLPAWIGKLTNLQRLHGKFVVRRGKGQCGIGVLKDLVNLQGTLCLFGLRNLVNIEDAKNANLKSKHGFEQLVLAWDEVKDVCYAYKKDELQLTVSPQEDRDIPIDGKMEEAILKCFQPHDKLKSLKIIRYGGSKFPKWVGDPFSVPLLQDIFIRGCENIISLSLYIHDSLEKLDTIIRKEPPPSKLEMVKIFDCKQLTSIKGLHNLHSLKMLRIADCPQLQLISEEGLPLKLEYLWIANCQSLASLSGLQNLCFLKILNVSNCPQLQLISEEELPSKLEELFVMDCQRLELLFGLQNLTSLHYLCIERCPSLRIMIEDKLSHIPQQVKIVDCPGLGDWCHIQKINYT